MEPMLASVMIFAGNFAPRGWAYCEGQLLPIAEYDALFSLLGTTYGGDGRTTFGLPDLRGRVPIHSGNGPGLSPRRLGQKGGEEQVSLTLLEIPSHNHTAQFTNGAGTGVLQAGIGRGSATAEGGFISADNTTFKPDGAGGNIAGISISGLTGDVAVGDNGGSQHHNNMQPYACVNFIIALQGFFPSRG